MRLLLLPEELRPELKNPLGRLCRGVGLECVHAMEQELRAAKKIAAVGDMTAFYLLKADILPDLAIVDNRTKRMPVPDHVVANLDHDGYKRVEVKNPPATLTRELMDLIRDSLGSEERVKIVVDGEEDLATLPAILYAPLGSVVVYGQPNEGSVLVNVTVEKKRHIEEFMKRMIVEE
ncbi:MAG: GTP-dependent dephospho-CoA kinase family protein [Methanothrix sp.]|nr:GTP-dependent dephospho-CoA kinase family protein [Methanothrix sp.]